MALPINRNMDEYVLSTRMADVATAEVAWVAVPAKGRLVRAYTVVDGITNGVAVLSFAIDGATALAQTLTIASGTAAGEVDSVEFSQSALTLVTEGSKISITSDGGGSTTIITNIYLVIDRG